MRFGDSWDVQSDTVAIKEIDKTCLKGRETGVPVGMKSFFAATKLVYGEKKRVSLVYDDITHEGFVYINKTNRCKLSWQKDFAASLVDYGKIGDILRFERIADDTYAVNLIKNNHDPESPVKLEVNTETKQDEREVATLREKEQRELERKRAQDEREQQEQARMAEEKQKKIDRMTIETKIMTLKLELQITKGILKFFERRKLKKEINVLKEQLK